VMGYLRSHRWMDHRSRAAYAITWTCTMSSSTAIVARVHIVRHGETNENLQHIIQGQLDTVLNENGITQAKAVAVALNSIPFDVALSSDLKRAAKVR